MRIGYGWSGSGWRTNGFFWFAVAVLLLAFLADTASTSRAGAEARRADRNPLVRTLSDPGYIGFSLVRAVGAVAVLAWFWPPRLAPRHRSPVLLLTVPFSYLEPGRYFGAAVVLAAVPLKLTAAVNNLATAGGSEPGAGPSWLFPAGLVLGILFSNAVLLLQWRNTRGIQGDDREGDL